MKRHTLTVLPGDGIGPEIVRETLRVLSLVAPYMRFEKFRFGEGSGGVISKEILDSIKRNGIAIKGPTSTPSGSGHKSLNVQLRRAFQLFANVRPLKSLPNVPTPYSDREIDIVVIRENIEGEYLIREQRNRRGVRSSFVFTDEGCRRIATFAFEWARAYGRRKIHVGHKSNILKASHGLFLDSAYDVAKKYPKIECRDMIFDNFCMQLVRNPTQFDILLLTNLLGDFASDLCAGIVHGSLGFAGSLNVGTDVAIAEAVHGTAPDIVGKNIANPAALMHSCALLLDHIGDHAGAAKIRGTILRALSAGIVTKDVDRSRGVGTIEWTDAVIENI